MNTRTLFKLPFDKDASMRVDSLRIVWEYDDSPDLSYLTQDYKDCSEEDREKYIKEDQKRLMDYHLTVWCMMGCYVEATVSYPTGFNSRRLETFNSGGLWGIESDSGKDYIDTIELEQIQDLKEHLSHFGVILEIPEQIEQ